MHRKSLLCVCLILLTFPLLMSAQNPARANGKLRFEVSFPSSLESKPLDGHIMLCISTEVKPEPRFRLREERAIFRPRRGWARSWHNGNN